MAKRGRYLQFPTRFEKWTNEKEFLSLKEKGLEVHSLTKIYKDTKNTVYGDGIHASVNQISQNRLGSIGYEIMAKSISEIIAQKWGFTKISGSSGCL